MPAIRRHRVSSGSIQASDSDGGRDDVDSYDYNFQDSQFFMSDKQKLPWKTISFVIFFLIVGMICMTTAGLIFTEVLDKTYVDRASPLLILGSLMIIPGGYYGYILASILMERDGFSWEDIPEI
ncbi:transmembrane protein 230 [Anastrepha obliqua]|uniref:transmembrane protein 230 n=1 Tax=Anastrepha ludens TaxID=28586 RepID=UPI0023B11554|nr:transmembrane protein 230 [Anastrepha ludens]XP_053961658.1 transmembrane protein 230 [Anastrepha ludens]XP_054745320.1 transmembrane protein 230 [Anastrepha obliqua]XP_054745321.1 transmembrane protein 230 [Anastrepha obliqua]XP_054745322.1 transmembrane protein 230 [Anastrepha obliqua]